VNVSLQYAEEHLADLISAADRGEDVEIERPDKPRLKLVLSEPTSLLLPSSTPPRSDLLGSAKGRIWLADDWDSPETNREVEDLFENSVLFPESSPE